MTGDRLRELAQAATPGPWRIKPKMAAVYDDRGRSICSTWDMGDDGERMYGANRELIALAPGMAVLLADAIDALQACRDDAVLVLNGCDTGHLDFSVDRAHALLARFRALGQGEGVTA